MGNVDCRQAQGKDCRQTCAEECSKERKCYVDQNEVKVGPFDVMAYPARSTRLSSSIGQQDIVGDLVAAAKTAVPATPTTASSTTRNGGTLRPQSVSWSDGLMASVSSFADTVSLRSGACARPQLLPKPKVRSGKSLNQHRGSSLGVQMQATQQTQEDMMRPTAWSAYE